MKKPRAIAKYTKGRRGKPARPHVVSGVYPYGMGASAFGQKRAPSPIELVGSYRAMTYAFANRNARAVASQNLRLFGTTKRGQKGPTRECRTLDTKEARRFFDDPNLCKQVAGAQRIDEVVDHPIIDLLNWVNPWMDRYQLFELTQLYKEIVGYEMWTFAFGAFDRLTEIWPLPAWMVYPQPDFTGTDVIQNYIFTGGGGQCTLETDEVLYFRTNNLFDPYTQGYSPLRAAYELAEIWDKRTDYEDSVLTNRARPDIMLVSKDDLISPEEIQRYNQEFQQSFGFSGAGGVYIPPGGLTPVPISYPPKDMGELALSKETKINLAAVFDIPSELVDQDSPRAAKDAALLDYARNGIKPRCMRLQEGLNSNFVNRFDDRLFVAYDDPVPADVKSLTEKHGKLVAVGLETRNEARAEFGLPPVAGGDILLVPSNLVPLSHAVKPPQAEIVQPEGAARPEEIPDADRDPSEEGDDDHGGDVDETEDDAFEEGDDTETAKALGDEQRLPFRVPAAKTLLRRAMQTMGFSFEEHEDDTLKSFERLRILHQLRLDARAWLRREGERALKAIKSDKGDPVIVGMGKGLASKAKAAVDRLMGRAKKFLKNAFVAAALTVMGPGDLTPAEAQAIDQALKAQVQYLHKFQQDIITNQQPLDGRLPARAESYGASVWSTGTNLTREVARNQTIFTEELRVHVGLRTAKDPCGVCDTEEKKRWQPIGTLRAIGDSPCESSCHCHYVFRTAKGDEWIAGRGPLSLRAFGATG